MAKFTPVPNLDEIVARMVSQSQRHFADKVQTDARRLAPALKEWITRRDARVRDEHVATDRQKRPDNLRFDLPSMKWDMGDERAVKSQGRPVVGPRTYLLKPRDDSQPAVVTLLNCRCQMHMDQHGIAKLIKVAPTKVQGTSITTTVYVEAPFIIEAEQGDVYPGGMVSEGAWFMRRAVSMAGARGRTRR